MSIVLRSLQTFQLSQSKFTTSREMERRNMIATKRQIPRNARIGISVN